MVKYYVGLGHKDTPPDILGVIEDAAFYLAQEGWLLRTNGQGEASEAFVTGVDACGGKKVVYTSANLFDAAKMIICWSPDGTTDFIGAGSIKIFNLFDEEARTRIINYNKEQEQKWIRRHVYLDKSA